VAIVFIIIIIVVVFVVVVVQYPNNGLTPQIELMEE
jgi:hypothetical protein